VVVKMALRRCHIGQDVFRGRAALGVRVAVFVGHLVTGDEAAA
jgi:hypothetical protein